MPTTKTRINITVPDQLDRVIQRMAKRDQTSLAAKTVELIQAALELEEDAVLLKIAESRSRSTKKNDFLSHEEAWK